MNLFVMIFNTVQLLYCIIFNNHEPCNLFTWTPKNLYLSINVFILIHSNEYIYYFYLYDIFINDVTVFWVNLCLLIYEFIHFGFCMQIQSHKNNYISFYIMVIFNTIKWMFSVFLLLCKGVIVCFLDFEWGQNKLDCKSAHGLSLLMVIMWAFNDLLLL